MVVGGLLHIYSSSSAVCMAITVIVFPLIYIIQVTPNDLLLSLTCTVDKCRIHCLAKQLLNLPLGLTFVNQFGVH